MSWRRVASGRSVPGPRGRRLRGRGLARAGAAVLAAPLQAAFLLVALGLAAAAPSSPALRTMGVVFVAIVFEAMPFVLLGALLGGVVEVFVSRERVAALVPGRPWAAVLAGGALGLVLPTCECAVVPVVRRLLGKGVPLGAAVAYLLAAPVVNPLVALSTAVAYLGDWRVVAARTGLGYAVAVLAGLLAWRFLGSAEDALLPSVSQGNGGDHAHGCSCGCSRAPAATAVPAGAFADRFASAFEHGARDFLDVGRWLVAGAFVAALLQSLVARQTFLALASSPAAAVFAMMALAFVLNLCSESDAFVAASFRDLVPLPAQLAFMLLGPMLDVKLLVMYLGLFRPRAAFAVAASVVLLVAAAALSFGLAGGA